MLKIMRHTLFPGPSVCNIHIHTQARSHKVQRDTSRRIVGTERSEAFVQNRRGYTQARGSDVYRYTHIGRERERERASILRGWGEGGPGGRVGRQAGRNKGERPCDLILLM